MKDFKGNGKSLNEKTTYWISVFFFSTSLIIFLLDFFIDVVSDEILINEVFLKILLLVVASINGLFIAFKEFKTDQTKDFSVIAEKLDLLNNKIGSFDLKLLEARREFFIHVTNSVSQAQEFILDTRLTWIQPKDTKKFESYFSGYQAPYNKLLYRKVTSDQLRYERISIIYHKQALEKLIFWIFLYEGEHYLIKILEPPYEPNKFLPLMGMMSFDDKMFYLGDYHLYDTAHNKVLFIKDPNVASFFSDYWQELSKIAELANPGGRFDKDKIFKIADRLGVNEQELDVLIDNARKEAVRTKKQLSAEGY